MLHGKQWCMQQMQEGHPKALWCRGATFKAASCRLGSCRGRDGPPLANRTASTSSVYLCISGSMITNTVPCCRLWAAFLYLLRAPELPVRLKHGDSFCAQLQEVGRLHTLASEGALEPLRRCLAAGADVNERDAEGCTALHWAADRGHLQVSASPPASGSMAVQPLLQTMQGRTAQQCTA